MKTCSKCGEAKPPAEFNRSRRTKDGRYAYCRECANACSREWYKTNRERKGDYDRQFYRQRREQKLEYRRQRHEQNPEWAREATRRWYEANRGQKSATNRLWREQNPDYRRWHYEQKPERYVAYQAKRRALVDQKLTQDDQDYIKILRQDPCAYCGETGGVIDHIDPLAKGGTVDWTNLTAACNKCNARKHTSSLLDFLARSPAR